MKKSKVLSGKSKQKKDLHEKYNHHIPYVVVLLGNHMAKARSKNLYAQYDAALDRTHVHTVSYSPNNAVNKVKRELRSGIVVDIYLRDLDKKWRVVHFKVKNP